MEVKPGVLLTWFQFEFMFSSSRHHFTHLKILFIYLFSDSTIKQFLIEINEVCPALPISLYLLINKFSFKIRTWTLLLRILMMKNCLSNQDLKKLFNSILMTSMILAIMLKSHLNHKQLKLYSLVLVQLKLVLFLKLRFKCVYLNIYLV